MNDATLAELLARHASRLAVPGAAVGLLRDGRETIATYGIEDIRTGAPVQPGSRFSAGSLTKTMVAAVVARLVADRRLGYEDPVAARVPELARADWARSATIRDLLADRSGLPLRRGLDFDFDSTDNSDGALAAFATRLAAASPTPVAWSYTNAGFALLGRAIEAATGMVWEQAMEALLLGPAGMSGSRFVLDGQAVGRVTGHEPSPSGSEPVAPLTTRILGPAGTTLVSTIGDLLTFARTLLDDERLAPLRQVSAEPRIHAWLDRWCLGLARFDWPGATAWGWDSLIEGERGILRVIPERRAAVVLVSNSGAGRRLHRALLPELLGSAFGIEVPPLDLGPRPGAAGDLARYAGTYAWPDRRVDVEVDADTLRITGESGSRTARPIDERAFLVDPDDPDNPTVTFGDFDAARRPRVLYLMLWGLPRTGSRPPDRPRRAGRALERSIEDHAPAR